MGINRSCNFAPMFIVDDGFIWFPCDEDFIADELVKDQAGFDVRTVDGINFYPLKWLTGRNWVTMEWMAAFVAWANFNDIDANDIQPEMEVRWITKPGDGPEHIRTIGFSREGDAYVALDAVDIPKDGLEAKTTLFLDEKFICVQDWAKVDPDGFSETILGELLPMLAEKHGIECNVTW